VRRIAREGQLLTIISSSPEGEHYQPSICGQSKAALPQALLGEGLSLTRHSPPNLVQSNYKGWDNHSEAPSEGQDL
jgi:hypothetical protein